QPELRTIPPDNPHIWEEARFKDQDTRPIVHWGIQSPQRRGPIAVPGDYTVRMTVGADRQERRFKVLRDPAITTADDDLAESTRTQVRIRDGINRTVGMINRLEVMRKQIEDLEGAHATDAAALEALAALDAEMYGAEMHFLSRTDVHSDDKWYVESYKIYMQYLWLSAEVGLGAGDVQGGAEYRPTAAAMKWLETVETELDEGAEAFRRIVEEEVPAFNRRWAGRLPPITLALIS
ncbi:MAG TPA: hypothetical protein VLA36_07875, partial [Longimicrobiales bacterium]|nr:hypothetical protein [Longimicrobiales bacterium]